jgi:hypothetical protein
MPPKYIRNTGKQWTVQEERKLEQLAKKNTPTRVIGLELGRTANAIYTKASELGASLHPTNQSPYNRKK